jgi:hypothetical protein
MSKTLGSEKDDRGEDLFHVPEEPHPPLHTASSNIPRLMTHTPTNPARTLYPNPLEAVCS